MSNPNITNVRVLDLRFPTSRHQIGSDAVNTDPDYSAAYCIPETDVGVEGYGLAFTLGHGTELCVLALEYLAQFVKGRNLSSVTDDTVAFSRQLSVEADGRSVGEFRTDWESQSQWPAALASIRRRHPRNDVLRYAVRSA